MKKNKSKEYYGFLLLPSYHKGWISKIYKPAQILLIKKRIKNIPAEYIFIKKLKNNFQIYLPKITKTYTDTLYRLVFLLTQNGYLSKDYIHLNPLNKLNRKSTDKINIYYTGVKIFSGTFNDILNDNIISYYKCYENYNKSKRHIFMLPEKYKNTPETLYGYYPEMKFINTGECL